ncbi:hypothetical protein AC630_05395 [Bradyrhizobium sp. AS23.2]|nr:hypothetical protein AC630_05395 [Bradyrhizobium sp. AS23.2]
MIRHAGRFTTARAAAKLATSRGMLRASSIDSAGRKASTSANRISWRAEDGASASKNMRLAGFCNVIIMIMK